MSYPFDMAADSPPVTRPFSNLELSGEVHQLERPTSMWALMVASVAGIAAVGVLDYLTGVELRVFPLYFPPLAFGAWWLSRSFTLFLVLLATVTWLVANVLHDPDAAPAATWAFNTGAQLTAFAIPGVLISELRRMLRDERARSQRDPLTGLYNSRALRDRTATVLAYARRHRLPVTIAYLDLDNFKSVNDQFGHETGDAALNVVADTLRRHSRASDVVARVGGDEFVLVLLDLCDERARVVLERMRVQVGATMVERGWSVTASIGALCFTEPPQNDRDLMREADAAMYRAKRDGKDRIHLEHAPA